MIAPEETTNGGIFLPAMAQEKPQIGEMTAIASGKHLKDGSLQELEVSVGDKVLYSQYAGVIAEKDVLAIVD